MHGFQKLSDLPPQVIFQSEHGPVTYPYSGLALGNDCEEKQRPLLLRPNTSLTIERAQSYILRIQIASDSCVLPLCLTAKYKAM